MKGEQKRVLVACYGGGHVQSLIPIVNQLNQTTNVDLTIIGFTTARAAFARAGIKVMGYDCLLDESDQECLAFASQYLPPDTHPDISKGETLAYFAIGLRDLILDYGEEDAVKRFRESGRKAFLPVHTFAKYLKKITPDLVITSTSPRSELALQIAATRAGIESLAISDLFLQHESKYICAQTYARNITVMAGYVAKLLQDRGYGGNIFITGNPAFSELSALNVEDGKRLRAHLRINAHEQLILWVCPSASVSIIGKPFVQPSVMLRYLENFCVKNDGYRFLVRQHPSNPVLENGLVANSKGLVCPALISIEDCLSAANIVLLETSTVGLQAALLGLPVVTVDAGDYPPYARLGLSVDIPGFDELEKALLEGKKPRRDLLSYPQLGTETERVMQVIQMLLDKKEQSR
jgi:hypothetical protein